MCFMASLIVAANGQVKRVAITEVVDSQSNVDPGLKLAVRSSLTTGINLVENYEAYERVNISAMFKELDFQRSGYISNEQIHKIGDMTGASFILIPELARLFDDGKYVLTARIIDVVTGLVTESAETYIQKNLESVQNGARELAMKLLGVSRNGSSTATRIGQSSGAFPSKSNYTESGLKSDLYEMNINGKVTRVIENSYYTVSDGSNSCYNEQFEGGIFDDACFLSVVYSSEHIARLFYKKWFLSQVSDFEIQFDESGNMILLKSLWKTGGELYFNYDKNHRLSEMDSRNPQRNQSAGLLTYNYLINENRIVEEQISQNDGNFSNNYTIKYQYDISNNLCRAIMSNRYCEDIFSYINGKLIDIYLSDFWGEGIPASYQIEYNTNGDIKKVSATGKKGRSDNDRVTNFEYKYDIHKNWTERIGVVSIASGEEIIIKTTREYVYR